MEFRQYEDLEGNRIRFYEERSYSFPRLPQISEQMSRTLQQRGHTDDPLTTKLFDAVEALAKQGGLRTVRHKGHQSHPALRSGTGFEHFVDVYEFLNIGLVGAAATAVLARNILGVAKEWIELTKNTNRSVKVRVGGKEIEIKAGDDIQAIVREHFPDDGNNNPL